MNTDAQFDNSISVVIPCYNEAKNLKILVPRVHTYLKEISNKFEIICVDDGSKDDTEAVCRELGTRYGKRFHYIKHPKNLGYGAALRNGFQAATCEYVFYTDSDNQFDIKDLDEFLPYLGMYDVLVGYRKNRSDPAIRSLISWCYNRLVSFLLGIRVRDINCAFKVFPRELIQSINIRSNDFFVDAEILGKIGRKKLSIYEIGVRHYPRHYGSTTVGPTDVPRTLLSLARLYKEIKSEQ